MRIARFLAPVVITGCCVWSLGCHPQAAAPPRQPRAETCAVSAELQEDAIDEHGRVHRAFTMHGGPHPRERGCVVEAANENLDRLADHGAHGGGGAVETAPTDGETLVQFAGKSGASVRAGIRGLGPPNPCAEACRAGTSQLTPACNDQCPHTVLRLTPGAPAIRETRP